MERGRIDGIQPFAQLAEGSTTTVYKGYQERLDRFVLLKVLRPALARDEELARRFEEEARLVAQIQHPNVVTIHDYGRTEDRRAYLATEFVEGTDLRTLLEENGPLPPALAAFVLREAAKGLQAAHERGILHRDLKPANVLLAADGHVKLTDFGMASLMGEDEESELRGTPAYLAPEYVSGDPASETGDLFALGALLYEMLTARRAFAGGSTGRILDAVRHHDPLPVLDRLTRPPDSLRGIAEKLLAKEPRARYEDTAALLDDVNTFSRSQQVPPDAASLASFMDDPEAHRERAQEERLEPRPEENGRAVSEREAAASAGQPSGERTWQRFARYGLALLLGGLALWAALFWRGENQDGSASGEDPPAVAEQPERRSLFAGSTAVNPLDTLPEAQPDTMADETARATEPPAPSEREQPEQEQPEREAPEMRAEAPAAQQAALQLRVSPWAEVYLNGELQGSTPLSDSLMLDAGTHELVFKNESFPRDVHKTIRVSAGEERQVDVVLFDYVGRLNVEVNPWAKVYVNGTYRDTRDPSPQEHPFIVAPGESRLRLEHPQFGTHTITTSLEAGEEKRLSFDLRKIEG